MKCRDCDGYGKAYKRGAWRPCPTCNGTGRIDDHFTVVDMPDGDTSIVVKPQPTWIRERPTTPGWYWWWPDLQDLPECVLVEKRATDGVYQVHRTDRGWPSLLRTKNGYWQGPIAPHGEPNEKE